MWIIGIRSIDSSCGILADLGGGFKFSHAPFFDAHEVLLKQQQSISGLTNCLARGCAPVYNRFIDITSSPIGVCDSNGSLKPSRLQ
jgi:hypothetical protein